MSGPNTPTLLPQVGIVEEDLNDTMMELEKKMKLLESRFLRSESSTGKSPFAPISGLRKRIEDLKKIVAEDPEPKEF